MIRPETTQQQLPSIGILVLASYQYSHNGTTGYLYERKYSFYLLLLLLLVVVVFVCVFVLFNEDLCSKHNRNADLSILANKL